jgi:hypothetical protein
MLLPPRFWGAIDFTIYHRRIPQQVWFKSIQPQQLTTHVIEIDLCITQGNQAFAVSILSNLVSKDELKSLKMSWDCCHFVQQRPGRTATLHHHNLKHSSHRVPVQHILYRYELTTFDINSQVQVVDNVEELEKKYKLLLLLIHLRD